MASPSGAANPFISGTKPERIAADYLANHAAIGRVTMRALAAHYGTTVSTIRRSLRLAEPGFRSIGKVLTVPERSLGWVTWATDSFGHWAFTARYRLAAILVELDRFALNEATLTTNVGIQNAVRALTRAKADLDLAAVAP